MDYISRQTWVDRMVKEGKKIVYVSFGTNLVVDERMMDILAPTAQRLTKYDFNI